MLVEIMKIFQIFEQSGLSAVLQPAYSKTGKRTENRPSVAVFGRGYVFYTNSILLVLTILAFLAFIVASNGITSNQYRLRLLRDRLLSDQDLNSQLTSTDSPDAEHQQILQFAQSRGMVEARDAGHLFERDSVAIR